MSDDELVQLAIKTRQNAYAPHSKFQVGAAIRSDNGHVFVGCNVENASFGMTMCAERVAVGTAIAAGQCRLVTIAVASDGGHAPCGACRQVLAEFGRKMRVLLVDTLRANQIEEYSLDALFPGQFQLPDVP